VKILKEGVECFNEAYIILDALDECLDRHELLSRIEEIQGWNLAQLRMLVTSRRVEDIEDSLDSLVDAQDGIGIQSALVDANASIYIHDRLQNDQRLKGWRNMPHVQTEIQTTLTEKADGM
jgi:hypothetical protein